MNSVDATIERLGLKDMFEKADREGLWFYCNYQDLWFSPAQLRANFADERFRWGRVNWELRSPLEKLEGLKSRGHRAGSERRLRPS